MIKSSLFVALLLGLCVTIMPGAFAQEGFLALSQPSTTLTVSQSMEEQAVVSPKPEMQSQISFPEGALAPITLKATLQKSTLLPLSLENALKLASGQNISIQQEQENLKLRHVEFLGALSTLLPDLIPEYRQSRFVGGVQIFGGETVNIYRTTYQPQITLNYTIYTAGQNIFEIRAAKHREQAQEHLLESTRQATLSQVALAYYELQSAYWDRAIAIRAIQEAEVQVALNQARLDAGVGVRVDLLSAQDTLAQRQKDLVRAENLISQAEQQLIQLLDLDFDVDVTLTEIESSVVKLIPDDLGIDEMLATVKKYHPQLLALYKQKDARKSLAKAAFASVFPRIDISAYQNWTGPLPEQLILTRFGGIQASTTLLQGMGLRSLARVNEFKIQVRQADLDIAQAENLLQQDLANAMVQLKALEKEIQLGKESLHYAQGAYNHALGRLKEGVGTNIDLEAAMTKLNIARRDLASSFLDYNQTQVQLLASLGTVSIQTLTEGYTSHGTPVLQP